MRSGAPPDAGLDTGSNAGSHAGIAPSDTGTRHARFLVREIPYRIDAEVALPATGPGTMRVTVAADAARLGVRLTCGPVVDGIHSANIAVTTPPWLTVNVAEVVQDPDICHSPALATPHRHWWDRLGVTAGYGLTVGRDGIATMGPNVSASVRVWP